MQTFVGIDVGAQSLVVSVAGDKPFTVQRSHRGYINLRHKVAKRLSDASQIWFILEATGAYSMQPAKWLYDAGYQVAVINPAQSHYFSRLLNQQAKTDANDAQLLAHCGQYLDLKAWQPPPNICNELYLRLSERDQLLKLKGQFKNYALARDVYGYPVDSIQTRQSHFIEDTEKALKDVDAEIKALLSSDSPWQRNAQLLSSIKGFGFVTVGWLMVLTQNFAYTESAEELASFAGLVPHRRQSGTSLNSYRRVRHAGNRRLRQALYMATLTACRFNPVVKPFYEKKRAEGKPSKVARIACARKLTHIAWAVVRDQREFSPR